MEQIDIKTITDLQLCQFVIRANNELQIAIQNVQIINNEVSRREKIESEKMTLEQAKKKVEA